MQTLRREIKKTLEKSYSNYYGREPNEEELELINVLTDSVLEVRAIYRIPEGFPQPTGDALGDWLNMSRTHLEKNLPFINVCETLANEFHYNFPKFGENQAWDRVIKLISKDGRDVKEFVKWAKDKKRDPHWYHVKPDTLWGDFPQAFDKTDTFWDKLKDA